MNFFKTLFGRRADEEPIKTPPEPEPPAPEEEDDGSVAPPELYNGMKVEVMTPDNHLLFVGRLKIYGAGVLEVRSETVSQLPMAIYKQEVKLRGFQRNSQAFTLNGTICRSTGDFWHIENLKFLQSKDSRNFYRQNTDMDALIVVNARYGDAGKEPCKVLDISGGGVRVVSKHSMKVDDRFVLEAPLLPNDALFSITCLVVRVSERRHDFEYGCQFLSLPQKDQERLLQAIFAIQRKMLQSRRD